jgi:hypothetical protein
MLAGNETVTVGQDSERPTNSNFFFVSPAIRIRARSAERGSN